MISILFILKVFDCDLGRRNNLNSAQSSIHPVVKTGRASFNDRTSFTTVIQLKDGLNRKRSGSSEEKGSVEGEIAGVLPSAKDT